jgi:hypothetical protein
MIVLILYHLTYYLEKDGAQNGKASCLSRGKKAYQLFLKNVMGILNIFLGYF